MWTKLVLDNACDLITRGISPKYLETGGIRVLNQKCIRNHTINYELARRHDISKKGVKEERYIKKGDVLINSTGHGTLGRVAQVRHEPDEPTTVDSHITIVRPKSELFYSDYFGYAAIFIEDEIKDAGQGTSGQTELSKTKLKEEFFVSFPSDFDEQQRIVAKLDAAFAEIDSAVSITQKKIGEGLKLKGNIISKFISDRKFEQKSLDNICLIGDGNHSSNYPKASEMVNEGVPFLRAGNIQNGKIDATDLKFISLEKHEILKKGHLKFGDVLLTNRGEIGKTAIIPKEFDGANLNSQVAWLRCGEGLDENYLYYCLNSKEVCEEFVANKTGAALQQLTIKKIKQLKIPVPSFAEQMKIVEALNAAAFALEQLNDAMSAQIHKYQSLKKAILAQELRSEAA